MKILIVHPAFYCYGGAELCIEKLSNYLVDKGHEVDILTSMMIPEVKDDIKSKIVFTRNFEEFKDIYKNYDVINFYNHPVELLLPEKYPSVWYCNEPPDSVLDKRILPNEEKDQATKTISRFIVADKRNAKRFKDFYSIDPDIVPYGVDYEFWSSGKENKFLFETERRFSILQVGMIHPRKNQSASVLALLKLKDQIPNIKLLFAGLIVDQNYFNMIYKFIQENKLEDQFQYIGNLDRKDLRDLYHSVDLLVHPIKDQGGWLSPFDAMASGLLVIISPEANPSEIIEENRIGIVCNPDNLEEPIIDISKNPEKYNKTREKASLYVKDNLSWEKYSERIKKILLEVKK